MADIKLLSGLLLFIIGIVTSQDVGCGSSVIESHGKAIIFLQQLRPVVVRQLRHLVVEICPETTGNFYVQVWRNETLGRTPQFKLIWQYLVDRQDPTQALFTIPESLQLDLTGLTPSHIDRLYFGVTAPSNATRNLNGQIPVRSYFSLNSQSLVSKSNDDAGLFTLGEVRQFTELYYPYFFVLSLCEDGDVTKCKLPTAPDTSSAACGIPGRVISNITEVPFRGQVKAVMVDFCALNASVEVVLLAPVQGTTSTTYSVLWRQTIQQHGPLHKPTIVNVTSGPTVAGADYHLVVRSLTVPSRGSGVIPVREIFDPLTLHTRTHPGTAVPTTLQAALHYPYFLPVIICANTGCENPVEMWARDALGLGKGNLTTTVATPVLDIDNVTLIEWPPLPGPPGVIGMAGVAGVRGAKGDLGPLGAAGTKGPQGPLGAPGYRGPKGETGFGGIPGAPAPIGPPGPPGETGETGDPGDAGQPGQRGVDGKPGVNNNSPVSPVVASATEGCSCSPLVSSMLVLGLVIWAVLLTLLVVLLLVVASKNVNASNQHHSTTQSIR